MNQFLVSEDRDRCDAPFSKEELAQRIYIHNWNIVGDDLLEMVNYSCTTGTLSREVNAGMICLISKIW